MTEAPTITVEEIDDQPGVWSVELIAEDEDPGCRITQFHGQDARQRAEAYRDFLLGGGK